MATRSWLLNVLSLGLVTFAWCDGARAELDGATHPAPRVDYESARPEHAPEPRVSYSLHAQLHQKPVGFDILGRGTIHLTNSTPVALTELPVHLYMNAFRESSLARKSPFYRGRAAQLPGAEGAVELERCVDTRTGATLTPVFDLGDSDRTTAVFRLPTALLPGEELTLDIQWTVHLPRIAQRTGYERDFVFAGQWFPKLAKLEPDGRWVQFPFHPQAEFYANFGDYEVTIDTPSTLRVGASGELVEQHHGETHSSRYRAKDVHDFAWTAWAGFEESREEVAGIRVHLLFPDGSRRLRELTLLTLRRALPWMIGWLGPFPSRTLTVVHPPLFAQGAGGMEYPSLITTGGSTWASFVSHDIQRVILHELAHQWFQGALANNEYAWPFLDEGLTSYVEDRAMVELFDSPQDEFLIGVSQLSRHTYSRLYGKDVPIASSGPAFPSFNHLAALAYDRTALLLETFRRVYGGRFDASLREYVRRHRGKHPTPDDFLAVVGSALGQAAQTTLHAGLTDRGYVNYRVAELQSRQQPTGGYENRVVAVREGALNFPVAIEVRDALGRVRRETWDDAREVYVFEFESDAAMGSACIDPDGQVAIEDTRLDNCQRAQAPTFPRYWGLVLGWLQMMLS